MKRMFLKWVIFACGFAGTILLFIVWYAAWSTIATKTTGTIITESIWNEIVNKVNDIGNTYAPTGFVWAFNLTTCPTWWIPADGSNGTPDLRGQFLRWINSFDNWITTRTDGKQDPDCALRSGWTCSIWSYQVDDFKSHSHTLSNGYTKLWYNPGSAPDVRIINSWAGDSVNIVTAQPTGWNESRPRNVWVIFCIKQ